MSISYVTVLSTALRTFNTLFYLILSSVSRGDADISMPQTTKFCYRLCNFYYISDTSKLRCKPWLLWSKTQFALFFIGLLNESDLGSASTLKRFKNIFEALQWKGLHKGENNLSTHFSLCVLVLHLVLSLGSCEWLGATGICLTAITGSDVSKSGLKDIFICRTWWLQRLFAWQIY